MSTKKPRTSTSSRQSRSSHRSTLSLSRTEIVINVYDLLPPGRLSSVLWTLGSSLLHTGVVINGREYAYGGHDRPHTTGVYWTVPRAPPPGATFRTEMLHGFTFATAAEIDAIVRRTSEDFTGTAYNLLTRNCNHFTQELCARLTGRRGPTWLNRAAQIGVTLPCIVPRDWLDPPDYATADGELVSEDEQGGYEDAEDEEEDVDTDERTRFLNRLSDSPLPLAAADKKASIQDRAGSDHAGSRKSTGSIQAKDSLSKLRDSGGRMLPVAEHAPAS